MKKGATCKKETKENNQNSKITSKTKIKAKKQRGGAYNKKKN